MIICVFIFSTTRYLRARPFISHDTSTSHQPVFNREKGRNAHILSGFFVCEASN